MEKTCTRCNLLKSLSDFSKHKRGKNGLQSQCKTCCQGKAKEYYYKDHDEHQRKVYESRKIRREYLKRVANDIKMQSGCVVCGEHLLCILEFHHVIKDKRILVGQTFSSYVKFENEVNKCAVLCANCHKKVHSGLITIQDSMRCKIKVQRLPQDRKTPTRSRCTTRWLTCNGETRSLAEWGEKLKIDSNTIRERLNRGWTIDEAFEYA